MIPEGDLAQVLLDRSPNGVLVVGPDGRVRLVNPALLAMVPVIGDPIGRAVGVAVPVASLAKALDPTLEEEVELTLRSGNRDLLSRVISLGEGRGRMAIVQDVTRLRESERYRSEFIANVAHELRTPATAISGYAETLLEDRDQLDPAVADMVEVIYRNGQRLNHLFDDLLVIARLDARNDPLPLEPVVLASSVAEAIDKLHVPATDKGIHFEVLVPAELRVRANRDALGHVVGNLISNAVKYSYDAGIVTVRAMRRDRWVLFEVIDVGIGIDPAHQELVFERFYRVDKGRSRAAGGTGLGLSIVKKLVEMMGAAVEVRSRPGSGSVFRVLFAPAEDG